MLAVVSKTLLSALTLTLLVSCGKKATSGNIGSASSESPEQQLPSSSLVTSLTGKISQFYLSKDGFFSLPEKLHVVSNNGTGKKVTVFYNFQNYAGSYEFKCVYFGVASDYMIIKKCTSSDDGDYGAIQTILEREYFFDAGKYIKMETPATDLRVEAVYNVKWF